MSAQAAWDVVPSHAPARSERLSRRGHLHVVPDLAVRAERPDRLRLTPAGRLAAAALLAILVVLIWSSSVGASRSQPAVAPVATVTVQAGQTLSELAAVYLPDLPIAQGVARLQVANALNVPAIHAGQRLVIPAVP